MARRGFRVEDFTYLEVDDPDGKLYWKGVAVVMERKISLEGWTLVWVAIGAIGAVLAGVWPIVDYLWLP